MTKWKFKIRLIEEYLLLFSNVLIQNSEILVSNSSSANLQMCNIRQSLCCYSVTLSCLTVSIPMDYSTPGFSVLHHLPELAQTHVHWVCDAIQPSHPVVPFSSCLQSFPVSGSFPMSQLFVLDDQCIGASASASVPPMNIQDWFPLGWTSLISL